MKRACLLAVSAAALLGVALAASCGESLDSLGSFPCAKDGSCPTGWSCTTGTCYQQSPVDAGPCKVASDCGSSKVCVAVVGGGSMCVVTCNGASGSCGSGFDCKLVNAANKSSVVPACVTTGSKAAGMTCASVNECAADSTCDGEGLCIEQCSLYHNCSATGTCPGGGSTYPTNWGLCK